MPHRPRSGLRRRAGAPPLRPRKPAGPARLLRPPKALRRPLDGPPEGLRRASGGPPDPRPPPTAHPHPHPPLFEYAGQRPLRPQNPAGSAVHSLGRAELSRIPPQGCPPEDHRRWSEGCGNVVNLPPQTVDNDLVHQGCSRLSTARPQADRSYEQLLHRSVHCSATKRAPSPDGVKAVTPRCWIGLGTTWVFLGTSLGRTPGHLCIGCAQLPAVHSGAGLSTGSTHRRGG